MTHHRHVFYIQPFGRYQNYLFEQVDIDTRLLAVCSRCHSFSRERKTLIISCMTDAGAFVTQWVGVRAHCIYVVQLLNGIEHVKATEALFVSDPLSSPVLIMVGK